MNVWILSVRELARLLRGRLTWLAAALTVLSPLAGLTVYRSASADTMQSLYVANPALAGGVLGGLFFALLTLCDCARTSRCRVEVLCDAAVSPLTAALARLMALLGTAALTLALTLLTWLPWTAHTVGAVFDGGIICWPTSFSWAWHSPCVSCWPGQRGSSPAALTCPWCWWPLWRP